MPDAKTILSQDLRWAKLQVDPTCSNCGITKTPSDFPRNAVDYWCSACRRDYARSAWRAKRAALSPEAIAELNAKIQERQRQQRRDRMAAMLPLELAAWRGEVNGGNRRRVQDIKDQVYAAYGGYVCNCCGETEPTFLSIDHVNNNGAAQRKSGYRGGRFYYWLAREGFPAGFQVLCMNCQWGKRNNRGVCPHQAGKVQRSSREGVGPSGPKRSAPSHGSGDDMICSAG